MTPTGEIVALAATRNDELIVADCDLALCRRIQDNIFNFAEHREPQHYGLITARKGARRPSPEPQIAAPATETRHEKRQT